MSSSLTDSRPDGVVDYHEHTSHPTTVKGVSPPPETLQSFLRLLTVWRCTVCRKVKDLQGAHLNGKTSVRSDCWPCAKKTTFVKECSSDTSLGIDKHRADDGARAAGDKGVFGSSGRHPTVFKSPVVPSEAEEPSCMLSVKKVSAAEECTVDRASAVHVAGNTVWRCTVCRKVKDLQGAHLNGKTSVRSDCWPCAKKTTFFRDGGAPYESGPAAQPVTIAGQAHQSPSGATHLASDVGNSAMAASTPPSSFRRAASSSQVSEKQVAAAPFKSAFGDNAAPAASRPAAATPFKSAFGDVAAPAADKPAAATPFKSAFGGVAAPIADKPAAAAPFKSAFGDVAAPIADKPAAAAPFKSAFGDVAAPAADKPAAATPFKSAFGGVAAPIASMPAAAAPFKSAFGDVAVPAASMPAAAAPFKSAFGDVAVPAASKPAAAAPFKSAFGDVAVSAADKPAAAAPFKSAFDDVAVPSADKPPAATPFKSAFGGVAVPVCVRPDSLNCCAEKGKCGAGEPGPDGGAPYESGPAVQPVTIARQAHQSPSGATHLASDVGNSAVTASTPPSSVRRAASSSQVSEKQVAATPFKSAFGDVAVPAADKPPAAAPIKSAFGDIAVSAASKPPAATPFKSAFGDIAVSAASKPRDAPFKSAFGDIAVPAASKPAAAAPFKSAFGDVAVPAAGKPPAAAPFKSAFGDIAVSAASKPPATTPFKSAFGDVAVPAADKPPAATPFKSAFGDIAVSAASKPAAAAPFKSAFGDVAVPSADKPPAATPFKSASGGVAVPVFVRPDSLNCCAEKGKCGAGEPGPMSLRVSTASVDAHAATVAQTACLKQESVWRCTVCRKVKDLQGTHLNGKTSVRSDCWPCAKKTTFVKECSSDTSLGIDKHRADDEARAAGDKGVFGSSGRHPTVFKSPVVPSEAEEPSCMLSVKKVSAAEECTVDRASAVHVAGNTVWRCTVCRKVKDLQGAHLNGKTSVRSDCWPCAKKTTFFRDGGAPYESGPAAQPVTIAGQAHQNPSGATHLASDVGNSAMAASTPPSSFRRAASSSQVSEKQVAAAPFKSAFGDIAVPAASKPAAAAPFKSAFGDIAVPAADKPAAATPFKSAFGDVAAPAADKPAAAAPFKSVFGGVAAPAADKPAAAAPFKSAFGGVAVPVCVRPDSQNRCAEKGKCGAGEPGPMSLRVSTASVDAHAATVAQTACLKQESVWRCTVCRKVKDLQGAHLNGKTSVRSDCWPCAKKTTFVKECSSDTSLGIDKHRADDEARAAGDKGVFGSSGRHPTVFKSPVVPSEAEEPSVTGFTGGSLEPICGGKVGVTVKRDTTGLNVTRTPSDTECVPLAVVEALITQAWQQERESIKADLEVFRKDLLFEVRQAISQAYARAVAAAPAVFEKSPAQMTESLASRHLSRAFRKS
ncbi:hypothetical protein JKF63_03739 [Porcisia hertigi]|uniref:Uncharacterized protein n=1 Tax=Porcisia hertigi TaxID=2761500 RepID=A0A836IHA6_9TRYP|nr:hypothetical protein JKF63_03739 [Porcisia hertigi]